MCWYKRFKIVFTKKRPLRAFGAPLRFRVTRANAGRVIVMESVKAIHKLEQAGMARAAAEAVVECISSGIEAASATKADLVATKHELRTEVQSVRADVRELRAQLEHAITKSTTQVIAGVAALLGLVKAISLLLDK
jgi:vesicle coat complex subunit